jgi:hypothetical protein
MLAGLLVTIVVPGIASAGDVPAPSQWPASATVAPEIESWTNAIRYSGPNREQTSLALALGLRGRGDYPFDTPDPSSGGAPTLAAADDWWGVGTCPRAIIVVAGDTPADSLAASSLSDPTDQSTEPFLQRSASADPLFDPIDGFARVDTQTAPVIVTRSARQGATGLGASARVAAQDLRSGGCTLARQAIIVGGASAVPATVDDELVALGYDEVFRVAGANRYATAAAIADALGTGNFVADATACLDPVVDDGDARMGFYGNAAVELRTNASSCRVLGRTVVLAEGLTGADALAAGWWTSFWQVPVLLHDGSNTLPAATASALSTLAVDNVIVLGGPARIPESVINTVRDLTDADITPLAGSDRYATSVEMARRLGGWWTSGRADEYSGSLVCIAASSGDGASGRGWPDALGAGPWCGAANGAAAATQAPVRAFAPLTGEQPGTTSTIPGSPHDAVPVLLVPAGATTLPSSVRQFLTGAFEPTDSFCSSVQASEGCAMPGFVVAVGGATVLPSALIASAAQLVAGGTPISGAAPPSALAQPFYTSLDLSPVFATNSGLPDHVCAARNSYVESRWLAVLGAAPSSSVIASTDAMLDGRYVTRRRRHHPHTRRRIARVRIAHDWFTNRAASPRRGDRRTDRTRADVRHGADRPVPVHGARGGLRTRRSERDEFERQHLQRRVDHTDLHHALARHRRDIEGCVCTRVVGVDHVHDHPGHRPAVVRRRRPVHGDHQHRHAQRNGDDHGRRRGAVRRWRLEAARPHNRRRRLLELRHRVRWIRRRPRHRSHG